MLLKINNIEIPIYPSEFTVTPLDLDNADSSVRTSDGTLNRDRIAVKRQIEMTFSAMNWATMSALLQATSGVFFDFYYPDPMDGTYVTRTFYVGNRPVTIALPKGNDILWTGLKVTLIEK